MKKYEHDEVEIRIIRILNSMPYSGLQELQTPTRQVGFSGYNMKPITLEALADYLEKLREIFRRYTDEAGATKESYRNLLREVDAAGSLLKRMLET